MTTSASAWRARPTLVALALVVAVTGVGLPAAAAPPTSNCPLFPSTNVWNKRVDSLPVHPNSEALIDAIGRSRPLHPDFGEYLGYGIPYNVVDSTTPRRTVKFDYDDESDHVPYPIPGRRRSRAAATATCSCGTPRPAACTSCLPPARDGTAGMPDRGRPGT